MSLSALCGFRELLGCPGNSYPTLSYIRLRLLCTWVQIASKALHDANDALLSVIYITRITKPHFHCFSDPRFGAVRPKSLADRLAFIIYSS